MMSPPRLLATAMDAHLPRLFFLLLVFLAVHVPASHGNPALLPTTYDDSMCSDSYICGSVKITYPFYLTNTIRETADYRGYYSCGYTDLNISCQGEGPSATPVIHLSGANYTVLDISYESDSGSPTVTLADSGVLADGSCPAVRHGVSFDDVWLHYSTSSNENLTFYFGCYPREPSVPPGLNRYQINCDGFANPVLGGGFALIFAPDDHDKAQEHELDSHCKEVVSVLVKNEVLMEMASNWTNITSGGYGYLLKQGFELVWSRIATDQQCELCEKSGGKCGYSQNKKFLYCLCSDRNVGNTYCNSSGASTAPSSASGKSFRTDPTISHSAMPCDSR